MNKKCLFLFGTTIILQGYSKHLSLVQKRTIPHSKGQDIHQQRKNYTDHVNDSVKDSSRFMIFFLPLFVFIIM